ncbi:hypothetical protein IKE96_03690 [bacterium]|nr:hypothetical protein [bacterium]
MQKKYQGLIYIGMFVVFSCLGLFFIPIRTKGYHLLFLTIGLVSFIKGILFLWNTSSPDKEYVSKIKNILSTYDSILVKVNSVPKIGDRSIVNVMSIDDLIDAQYEINKPICYMKQSESCSFLLFDRNVMYVYVEKLNSEVKTPVEIELEQQKNKRKNRQANDSIFQELDKTSVVRLSNLKSCEVDSNFSNTTKIEAFDVI